MSGVGRSDSSDAVRLRPMVDADRALIRAIEDEPEGNAMANVTPRTDEQFEAHWRRVLTEPDVRSWVIELDAEGGVEPVGFVTVFVTGVEVGGERAQRRCVGYRIGRAWWGRGIASRALAQMLERVVERPLWAVTASGNAASQRVLAKCGFAVVETRWSAATARYPAGDETVVRLG